MYSYEYYENDQMQDMQFFNEKKNADEYAAMHMSAHTNANKVDVLTSVAVDGCFEYNTPSGSYMVWVAEVKPLDAIDESADVWVA